MGEYTFPSTGEGPGPEQGRKRIVGRKGRRFSVEEKLRILEEARQPKTTVAEVLQ